MNTNDFVNKMVGDAGTIFSLLEELSYNEICVSAAQLLSMDPNILDGGMISALTYNQHINYIKKNISLLKNTYERLADSESANSFSNWLRYMIVPYQGFFKASDQNSFDDGLSDISESADFRSLSGEAADITIDDQEKLCSDIIIDIRDHIYHYSPDLRCTIYSIKDMCLLPELLLTIRNNYTFYFRNYIRSGNLTSVLYCCSVKEKKAVSEKSSKKIVALHYGPGWTNTELTKDCGFIPYLMYKNHNCDSYMVGVNKDNYKYLDTYVKGMKMEFLKTGSEDEKAEYIKNNASEIDGLLLRGAYYSNIPIAKLYKKFNPEGKIYVGLDANSHWMDRIVWDDPDFISFLDNCDVIATSCTAMQEHLNRKWPCKVEYIPNGYIEYGDKTVRPDFEKKTNTILTVSRLGTAQKATDILLESFAVFAEKNKDWNLKLVGSIDESFEDFIEDYYVKHPELTDRVIFTGSISDKHKLTEEYFAAKIFALPSVFEGGTPNVVAEALKAGCVMAVTKIDAWEDAVNFGKCGKASEIGDVYGFANILDELCNDPDLQKKSENAYDYSRYNYDMEKVTARIYEMMFGGEE